MRNLLTAIVLFATAAGACTLAGCSASMRSDGVGIPATIGATPSLRTSVRRSHIATATELNALHGLGRPFAPITKHTSWFAPRVNAKSAHLLYVANWYGNGVEIYSQATHAKVGFIDTSPYEPNSTHVDADGNIWVVLNNAGSDPSIYVYKPGKTSPFRTLTGVTQVPVSVAIAPDKTVYVTDENIGFGEVEIFKPGKNTPSSSLHDPTSSCCGWVAVDKHGNLFWTFEAQSDHTGFVDEYKHGKGSPVRLGMTLTTFPGGIEALDDGSIVVVEQGIPDFHLTARIDTFPKGASQPSNVILGDPNCDNWVGPALDKKENTVYVGSTRQAPAQCGLNNAFGIVEEYSYPSGTLLNQFNDGFTNQGGWTLLVPAASPAAAGQ